jgi:hypothetical protein
MIALKREGQMMDAVDLCSSSLIQDKTKQTQNLMRTGHQTQTTIDPTSILGETSRDDIVRPKIFE